MLKERKNIKKLKFVEWSLYFISIFLLAASCQTNKKSISNDLSEDDTIRTNLFDGKWAIESFFQKSEKQCKNDIILHFSGSAIFIHHKNQLNGIKGVYKLKDSLKVQYFYIPMATTKVGDRYLKYSSSFINKFFYLNDYNARYYEDRSSCYLDFVTWLTKAKYYKIDNNTLVFSDETNNQVVLKRQ